MNEPQAIHQFEEAGLGKAPFHCVDFFEGNENCQFCGTFLKNIFVIQSSDHKVFAVGSDCVLRTGDAGLAQSFKENPQYKAFEVAKKGKAKARRAERRAIKYAVQKEKWAEENKERDAIRAAEYQEFLAENPGFLPGLERFAKSIEFLANIKGQLDSGKPLSPTQCAVALRTIEQYNAKTIERANSRYLGAVGEKIEVVATCKTVLDFSYGEYPRIYKYCFLMETEDGQIVKYIGAMPTAPRTGDKVLIVAKVKECEEYKGIKQTRVERPKFTLIEPEQAPHHCSMAQHQIAIGGGNQRDRDDNAIDFYDGHMGEPIGGSINI